MASETEFDWDEVDLVYDYNSVYVRPMVEFVNDLAEPGKDAARWPIPLGSHDLENNAC